MLANGRPYLAIPGPSVMPDRVLNAMHRAAPNIYTGELHDMTRTLFPDLKRVARTAHNAVIYIGNGHAAWEAALSNVLSRGDTILILATGAFGHGWATIAKGFGVTVDMLDFGVSSGVDPARVEEALTAAGADRYKAVLVCQVDTATSARSDIAAIRAAMDRTGHPALLMVDCIASLACDRFEMDAWGVDVVVAASQKGLMVPPGLCFVFFGPKAAAVRETADCVTHYWDWKPRANPAWYSQNFDGTAPTHHLYGLRTALDMIHEEGIEAVWHRHAVLARTIWAAFEVWSSGGPLHLNITDPNVRSHAVTSAVIGAPDGDRLRAWAEQMAGLTLGIGLGRSPESGYFRIGHMGHVSAHMILGALGTIDAGLKALAIPHGRGALDAAAQMIADAANA